MASRFFTVCTLLFCSAAVTKGGAPAAKTSLQEILAEYNIPSLAYAVVSKGQVIQAGAVGTRRAGMNIPVTVSDRYHIGSDTKSFTTLLVGELIAEGKLTWTTTLGQLFPEWNLNADIAAITMDQLMSHTSGLPADGDAFETLVTDAMALDGNLDVMRRSLVQTGLATLALTHPPGGAFNYSNFGYVTLGAVVEMMRNSTWEEVVTERILRRFPIRNAGIGCQASLGLVDAPLAHELVNGTLRPLLAGPNCDNPAVIGPAGRLHMSVLDLAAWVGWHAAEGRRAPYVVPTGIVQRLHQPATVISTSPLPPHQPITWYARGWGIAKEPWYPRATLVHAGSNGNNLAFMWADPVDDWGMVMATNVGGPQAEQAIQAASALVYERMP